MLLDALTPRYAPVDTLLGPGWFAYTARGVVLLSVGRDERAFGAEAVRELGARPVRKEPPVAFRARVESCIERGDGTEADLSRLPPFQRRVLDATAAIPYGEARSYGWVADAIGAPRAARAVGTALAGNPVPLLVPCHRVIRSDGALGEYGIGGVRRKRMLLEAEGYGVTARTSRRRA